MRMEHLNGTKILKVPEMYNMNPLVIKVIKGSYFLVENKNFEWNYTQLKLKPGTVEKN